ncbi:MAG: bifunctional hydroxymethylpyrimidine kinase/phosphomethylpyrimidine kinase [Candidatus Aquicultor secundus]|nr:MAG: bifunctional hydroxymethylpyrimidine kinase/phosphomethylpyrimidine kinase [Candidatus Aquicultor secundus]
MGVKKVLAIGGSDPSGGAGIQADIKTFVELGIYPYTALSAVTVQNSRGVSSYEILTAKLLHDQIASLLAETDIHAVKTGMLGSSENMIEVGNLIAQKAIGFTVIDPVLRANNGKSLVSEASLAVLKKRLLPHSFMVTPNLSEASCLTGVTIVSEHDFLKAAKILKDTGVAWVLIKGGHLEGTMAVDLLYDGEHEYYFEAKRVRRENVRGTGCMMASAICAYLVHGLEPDEAVDKAKAYVYNKINKAVLLGKGSLQALHFANSTSNSTSNNTNRGTDEQKTAEGYATTEAHKFIEGDACENRVDQ